MRYTPIPEPERIRFTSLIDVAFLVLIFFMSLPMRQLDGKLQAHLPKGEGIDIDDTEPPSVVDIRLRYRGGGTLYELGDHSGSTPFALEPVLRKLGPDNTYQLHADPAIDWQDLVGVLDLLQGLRYPKVRFRGASLPGPDLMRQTPLPRPGR